MAWDTADIAAFRAYESANRRWWALNFPPERGGGRPARCAVPWPAAHLCARPRQHPAPCMCYCGDRLTLGQGALW
jgi:hypothetical protein